MMQKSENAFRTIGEISKELGVKTHILRYWEEQFPSLNPLKRAGGRRHYRSEDVALLRQINRLLNEEGYTIKGARKALASGVVDTPRDINAGASASVTPAASGSEASVFDWDRLRELRNRLSSALESA